MTTSNIRVEPDELERVGDALKKHAEEVNRAVDQSLRLMDSFYQRESIRGKFADAMYSRLQTQRRSMDQWMNLVLNFSSTLYITARVFREADLEKRSKDLPRVRITDLEDDLIRRLIASGLVPGNDTELINRLRKQLEDLTASLGSFDMNGAMDLLSGRLVQLLNLQGFPGNVFLTGAGLIGLLGAGGTQALYEIIRAGTYTQTPPSPPVVPVNPSPSPTPSQSPASPRTGIVTPPGTIPAVPDNKDAAIDPSTSKIPPFAAMPPDPSLRSEAPGNPDAWIPFRYRAGENVNRVAGCTAFVTSRVYVPWSPPLGNANQWADKAQAFAESHPELGVEVDRIPQVGAIASWTWSPSGHVAQVIEADPNNPYRIRIAQGDTSQDANGNWNQPWGTWSNERTTWIDVSKAPYKSVLFIHLPWGEPRWSGVQ